MMAKAYNEKPFHDWASDGSDAFRYFALVCKTSVGLVPPEENTTFHDTMEYYPKMTLEAMFADREKPRFRLDKLRL